MDSDFQLGCRSGPSEQIAWLCGARMRLLKCLGGGGGERKKPASKATGRGKGRVTKTERVLDLGPKMMISESQCLTGGRLGGKTGSAARRSGRPDGVKGTSGCEGTMWWCSAERRKAAGEQHVSMCNPSTHILRRCQADRQASGAAARGERRRAAASFASHWPDWFARPGILEPWGSPKSKQAVICECALVATDYRASNHPSIEKQQCSKHMINDRRVRSTGQTLQREQAPRCRQPLPWEAPFILDPGPIPHHVHLSVTVASSPSPWHASCRVCMSTHPLVDVSGASLVHGCG